MVTTPGVLEVVALAVFIVALCLDRSVHRIGQLAPAFCVIREGREPTVHRSGAGRRLEAVVRVFDSANRAQPRGSGLDHRRLRRLAVGQSFIELLGDQAPHLTKLLLLGVLGLGVHFESPSLCSALNLASIAATSRLVFARRAMVYGYSV